MFITLIITIGIYKILSNLDITRGRIILLFFHMKF